MVSKYMGEKEWGSKEIDCLHCQTNGYQKILFFDCLIFFFLYVELMFLETSALTGENVEEAFLKCSRTILSKIETGRWLTYLYSG